MVHPLWVHSSAIPVPYPQCGDPHCLKVGSQSSSIRDTEVGNAWNLFVKCLSFLTPLSLGSLALALVLWGAQRGCCGSCWVLQLHSVFPAQRLLLFLKVVHFQWTVIDHQLSRHIYISDTLILHTFKTMPPSKRHQAPSSSSYQKFS